MANGTGGTGGQTIPQGGGGAEGAPSTSGASANVGGTFRVVQAWNQKGGIACVQPWIAARIADGSARLVTEQDGQFNGAPGTDPANDTHFWGLAQLASWTLPDCSAATIGDWDGTTPPEQYAASGGPPVYTTGDAVLDAASDVADAVEETAAKVGAGVELGLPLLLGLAITLWVWQQGSKS